MSSSIKSILWFISLRGGKSVSSAALHNGLANSLKYFRTSSRFAWRNRAVHDSSVLTATPLIGKALALSIAICVSLKLNITLCW